MYKGACTDVCTCTWVSEGCHSLFTVHFFSESVSHWSGTGQLAQPHLCLFAFEARGSQACITHPASSAVGVGFSLMQFVGIKRRSSCLLDKHFTDSALSPAPDSFISYDLLQCAADLQEAGLS